MSLTQYVGDYFPFLALLTACIAFTVLIVATEAGIIVGETPLTHTEIKVMYGFDIVMTVLLFPTIAICSNGEKLRQLFEKIAVKKDK